jgi:lipopolysaccharide export system permease protein
VKRLHRLVILSFLGPFVMTFFIVLFLLLMQFLWRYIDELVGKGLEINIIGELLLYASSGLVPLALPLAVLLSSLMTFGNMGEFYELTAIKASGISLRRVMMPVVIMVAFITVGAFFFSNNVLPITNLKMRSLRFDVQQLRPEVSITEGAFYNGLGNYSIRVSKKDPVTNILYDIKIYDHSRNKGNVDVTTADSGRMKMTADRRNMIMTLWNGYKYTEVDEGRRIRNRSYPHRLLKFSEQHIIIEMTGFEFSRSNESIFKNSYQMLNVQQLKKAGDSLKNELYVKSREFSRSLIKNSLFKLTREPRISFINSGSPGFPNTQGLPNRLIEQRAAERKAAAIERRRKAAVAAVAADKNGTEMKAAMAAAPKNGAKETEATVAVTGKGMAAVDARKAEAKRAATQRRADLEHGNDIPVDSSAKADSVMIVKHLKKIENFDSLFNSFDLNERQRIIKTASGLISQNQFLIVNTTSNMDYVTRLLRRHEIEWHRKFTLSFACLIFLFIGAPLGAIIRKGGLGLPTVISTLLFILYYIISLTGEKFVRESVMTSVQGMWLSSFVLIIAGIFLTYQATNDSAILNIDTYLNWVREKAGLRKGILLEKKAHIAGRFELIEIPRIQLQNGFKSINELAAKCLESLKTDVSWFTLAKKSFENTGFFYLIEFGIHYNSFIDQAILSKWFRITYFKKRLAEFPLINGRITSTIFTRKALIWISVIVFPVGLVRLIHLKLKVQHIRRSLKQVMELSTGMVNLLNSSALKIDAENM